MDGDKIGPHFAVSQEDRREGSARVSGAEAWQKAIVEAALDCVIVSDHEGRIIEFNAAAERTFGFARDAVVGKRVADVVVPASLCDAHTHGIVRYLETGRRAMLGQRVETVSRRSDGSEFPVELLVVPVELDGPPRFVAFLRELTDQKRTEEALRANLQIQSAINSLLEISLEPRPLNEQLERSLDLLLSIPWIALESKGAIFLAEGAPPSLVMKAQRGLSESLLHACAQVPWGHCLCGRAADTRKIVFTDCIDQRHDTRYEGMDPHGHYCVPIHSDHRLFGVLNLYVKNGHPRHPREESFLRAAANVLAGMIRRRQAEASLKRSEERFELAIKGSDAGIFDWDLRTNRVYFSPRWKKMLGFEQDEITDEFQEWENRVHPDDLGRAMDAVQDYLTGRTPDYELEHRLRHKDGSYRWILARGAAVRDAQGKASRMVGSHLDITDRKRAERVARRREAVLLAAERIQQYLLPHTSPELPGFDVAGATYPAEFAAADYFDYLCFPDGSFGVVVADVSGHGFSSALLTASTSAHIRSSAETCSAVEDVLERANAHLLRETEDGRFVTLILARIDLQRRLLSYVNAGHPYGYVFDASGAVKSVLKSATLPLGVLPDTQFRPNGPIPLEKDDLVLLLSDGVLEAQSDRGELFGMDRVIETVRAHRQAPAREVIHRVREKVQTFTRQDRSVDDLTIVVVKVQ